MGLVAFAWWVLCRIHPDLVVRGPQPMRWALLIWMTALLLSYAAGLVRGLNQLESDGQNLAILGAFEMFGVILVAADGLHSWDQVHKLLRYVILCSGFMALIGLLQFFLNQDVTRFLVIPGFKLKDGLAGFMNRDGFNRVPSTATHYIEFSACMATLLPFAIHLAKYSKTKGQRQLFTVMTLLDLAAIPITLSRTGLLALAIALMVMFPVWHWRMRFNAIIIGLIGAAGLYAIKPGLLGALRNMFFAAGNDTSISAREIDYPIVFHYFGQHPLLGRGPGTFIPAVVGGEILDNEWLGQLVSGGVIGVAAFLTMFLIALGCAVIAFRRATTETERHLCAALITAPIIAVVASGTFDSLEFTSYSFTFALLLGICGAAWRLTHPKQAVRDIQPRGLEAPLAVPARLPLTPARRTAVAAQAKDREIASTISRPVRSQL
jgi:O-antigen ligase